MLQRIQIDFATPVMAAGAVGLGLVLAGLLCRARVGRLTSVLLIMAMALLAGASGGMRIAWPRAGAVLVLVDRSASTRTAEYRDEARLRQRVQALLGELPFELKGFGEGDSSTELPPLDERPVLLFSDGQLELPASLPPLFAVLDRGLERPADGRIVALRQEGAQAIAIVENTGEPRTLTCGTARWEIGSGRFRIALPTALQPQRVALNGADAWPENDALLMLPPAPAEAELWSVGIEPAGGMRALAGERLPAFAGEYAQVGGLVLDAAAAARLDPPQQAAIRAYVETLGGTLLLVGRDAGWSTLRGSQLETISPLAVDPPRPTTEWVILLDASGSMGQQVGPARKWEMGLATVQSIAAALPRHDVVRVGSFGAELRWWGMGEAGATPITPPANLSPHGPTDLAGALEAVRQLPRGAQRQVVLLTDGEVELARGEEIAAALRARDVRLHCVLLAEGRGRAALEAVCQGTAGEMASEPDPRRWALAGERLARGITPARWQAATIQARRAEALGGGVRALSGFNRTWARPGAELLAQARDGTEEIPLAGSWRVGAGVVAAIAWPIASDDLLRYMEKASSDPHGAAVRIEWEAEQVRMESRDGASALVGEGLELRVLPSTAEAMRPVLERVGPAAWRGELPKLDAGGVAMVLLNGVVLERRMLPPTVAEEFAAIGNNRAKLQAMVQRSGAGRVIEPEETGPLDLASARNLVDLSRACGLGALAALAVATLRLRRL